MASSRRASPRWLGRLTLAIAVPLLVLLALEGALRLLGAGEPTGFWLREKAGTWRTNPAFMQRFFPPALARAPNNLRLGEKAPDTRRIFVLGGSAAQGVPLRPFGFSRQLETMLVQSYPGEDFEVVNVASTAINSHAVRLIAKACVEREPDLFLVYMGNNEVVGPFGPGSVLTGQVPPLGLIRASIWARGTRLGQLGARLRVSLAGDPQPREWTGMQLFAERSLPADDPRLETVYAHFEANLQDILTVAQGAGVPVVLSTVAVNLDGCPPFGSAHGAGVTSAEEVAFDAALGQEKAAEAVRLSPMHAEARYRYAVVLQDGGDPEAAEHFALARDLDTLRFRADSRINALVRELGGGATRLVDAAKEMGGRGAYFFEHVHFTFQGNYQLARTCFPAVAEALGLPPASPPGQESVAQALGYNDLGRLTQLATIVGMTSEAPFTAQWKHEERWLAHRAEAQRLRDSLSDERLRALLAEVRAAADARPGDGVLRARLALYELEGGRFARALDDLGVVGDLLPRDADFHALRGRAQLGLGALVEAEASFRRALELDPHGHQVRYDLVQALMRRELYAEAEAVYLDLQRRLPQNPEVLYGLGLLYLEWKGPLRALVPLRSALEIDPGHPGAGRTLIELHLRQGRLRPAVATAVPWMRALEDPTEASDLVRALVDASAKAEWPTDTNELLSVYTERVPGDLTLARALGLRLAQEGESARAVEVLRRVAAGPSADVAVLNALAWLAATDASVEAAPAEAIAWAERAAELTERRQPSVLDTLAAAYAAAGDFSRATSTADEAIALARAQGNTGLAERIEGRRARYAAQSR